MNHHTGHPWLSLLMLLLIITAVALAAIAFWRTSHATVATPAAPPSVTAPPRPADPALAELRLRYARGEIDHDEYVQRAANLGAPAPASGPGATA